MGERILIAGCGYVGSALADVLGAAGHHVFALRRGPSDRAAGAGFTPISADLTRADELSEQLAAADGAAALDVVVFCASASRFDEAGYREIYVDGLRNLVAALTRIGAAPRRVLFTSSTGVYGQRDGSWVDEGSPTEPSAFSGRVMLEAEAALAEAPWPTVALRLGGIYGPGRTRLIDSVRGGSATLSSGELDAPVYTNRIHRADCAGALAHLCGLAEVAPVYNGVDAEPASRAEVLGWLAKTLDAPQPQVDPAASAPLRRGGNKRVSSRRLRDSGYTLEYPSYREGYRQMLELEQQDPANRPARSEESA